MVMTSIYHADYCFALHCSLFVFVVNWYLVKLVSLVSIVRCTAVFVGVLLSVWLGVSEC